MSPSNRSQSGESLVSVLVAALLMSLIAAAIGSLAIMNTSEGTRLTAKVASLDQARLCLERVGRQIRMARNIGDLQGNIAPAQQAGIPPAFTVDGTASNPAQVPVADVENGTACNMSAVFPSTGDPYYASGGTMVSHVPTWPWNATSYMLSNDTLIVQVPTFDTNGMPYKASVGTANLQALDTYVYHVLPDPDYTAQMKAIAPACTTNFYKLEVAGFPADHTNMPANWTPGQPLTLLRGIVGPFDVNDTVTTFQYVNSKAIAGGQAQNSVTTNFDRSNTGGALNEDNLVTFTGIICNLQIMTIDGKRKPTVQALRSEMFLRNNASATLIGPPPGP